MIKIKTLCMLSVTSMLISTQINAEAITEKTTLTPINPHLQTQMTQIAKPIAYKGLITGQSQLKHSNVANFNAVNQHKIIIQREGASFIKVHFKHLSLPAGLHIEVKSKSGEQVHTYGSANPSLHTLGSQDNGTTSFSALSIFGDTAIIKLVGQSTATKNYRVEIDSIMEGLPQEQIDTILFNQQDPATGPLSTCGANERRDVQCWADSHPEEYERTRPVARLLINGSGACTAWRVGADNRMFTNNHCISSAASVSNTEVWFNYQNDSCGGNTQANRIVVTGDALLLTNDELDYTLFTVKNFAQIQSFGNFGLDVRSAIAQERIYIPQHGSGNPKELAIESDQNSDGLCRVDQPITDGLGLNTDMGYLCDTIGGSSGSPVLAKSSNKVLALHHFGGCPNQGVLINRIWPQVATFFNNQIPVGDNGQPSAVPVASFNFETNALEVSFTDVSSDSDGEIVNYQWDFGDGNNSIANNPVHTYSAAGNYPVTLTVTDNDGNTATNTLTISINNSNNGKLLNGIEVSNLSASVDKQLEFYFDVPAEARTVSITMSGGSGDADLYVLFGEKPTSEDYDCRPYRGGNNEACEFSSARTGRYYVLLKAYNAFSGLSIKAEYTEGGGSTGVNFGETNLSAAQNNWQHFTMEVPDNMTKLLGKIVGGSGDADLYLRYGSKPTTSTYDCRPYKNGNNETCQIDNPRAGTWYFSLRAYRSFSGLTLTGEASE